MAETQFSRRWRYGARVGLAVLALGGQVSAQSQAAGEEAGEGLFAQAQRLLSGEEGPNREAEAVRALRMAAEQGHAEAQYVLGVQLEAGLVAPKDPVEAMRWHSKAAAQGQMDSMVRLGYGYAMGSGVAKEPERGFELFMTAAKGGHPAGQFFVGIAYKFGQGVTEDEAAAEEWMGKSAKGGHADAQLEYARMLSAKPERLAEATEWLSKAAGQGHVGALTDLGTLHILGNQVPKDGARALQYLRQAAMKGSTRAATTIGLMYGQGLAGVPQSDLEGLAWMMIGAAGGGEQEGQMLEALKRKTAPALYQVAETRSQELAAELEAEVVLARKAAAARPATASDAKGPALSVEAWEKVSLHGICSFRIPPTMELEEGTYERVKDAAGDSVLKATDVGKLVIAQQKRSEKTPQRQRETDGRISVKTVPESAGQLGKAIELSEADLAKLNMRLWTERRSVNTVVSALFPKRSIAGWQPVKIGSVNGTPALVVSYSEVFPDQRQLVVREYRVPDGDRTVVIALSYLATEKDRWAAELEWVLNTFEFVRR